MEERSAIGGALLIEERSAELLRRVPPRRAALVLGGLVVGVCLLAAGVEDVFELGQALSVSSAFSALLVAVAGTVAWLAARTEARERGAAGAAPRASALVLLAAVVLLAGDELLSVHDRLDSAETGIGVAAYAVVVAVALGAFARTLAPLPRAARPWLGAGALAWAASVPLVVLDPEPATSLRALEELLQMAGSGALIVAALSALRARDARAGDERDGWTIAFELIAALDYRRLALAIAAAIAFFGLVGTIVIAGWDSRAFDLNEERTLPAYFSAALLMLAAVTTLALREAGREQGLNAVWLAGLALFFAVLGADEVAAVHERLQFRTGIWGQAFMLPLAAIAGVAMLHVLRTIGHAPTGRLLAGGVAAWGLAQVVDALHKPDGGVLDYLVVPEETGEMAGSTLLALGVLVAVRHLRAGRDRPSVQKTVV